MQQFWLCRNVKVTSELTVKWFWFFTLLNQDWARAILNGLYFPLPLSLTQSRVVCLGTGDPPILVTLPKREKEYEELHSPRGVMGTSRPTAIAFATEQEPLSWANRPNGVECKPAHSSPFSWVILPSPSAFLLAAWESPDGPLARLRLLAPGW